MIIMGFEDFETTVSQVLRWGALLPTLVNFIPVH